jgi:NADPH-dependent curcumin reductase CurA
MTATVQRIVLASRPQGPVTPDNFRLEQVPMPRPGPGEVLVRNHYLSLDPYMRGRMEESKSYAEPQKIGETMIGGTVGVIESSNHPDLAAGDTVVGLLGWQEYGVASGQQLMKVNARAVPMSAYLGPVGMPGVTAWYGLNRICEPKPGETVLVSAASGAVGSVVGQLAKQAGCRAIGIAGGPDKCEYVVAELGFDACLDHRQHTDVKSMVRALRDVAPQDIPIHNVRMLLVMRLKAQGFIVSDHMDVWPQALAELGQGVATGRIKYRESIADGLAAAPEAFIGLLAGRNFGKQLVKLA